MCQPPRRNLFNSTKVLQLSLILINGLQQIGYSGPITFVCFPSASSVCRSICRFLRPKLEIAPFSGTMKHSCERWLRGTALLLLLRGAVSVVMLPNNTGWDRILDKYLDEEGDWWEAKHRGKRAISDSDAQLILDLHNKLRGQVYPPASNMEYMVSGRRNTRRALFTLNTVFAKLLDPTLNPRIVPHTCGPQLVLLAQMLASMEVYARTHTTLRPCDFDFFLSVEGKKFQ